LRDIQKSIDPVACQNFADLSPSEKDAIVNDVSRRNVARVVEEILQESPTLNSLVQEGRLAIAGTIYDVATGNLEFLPTAGCKDTRVLDAV
jgi:carbonic anhydrase